MTKPKRIGLGRALSKMGYCSRSQAAELIRASRVTVNGKIVMDAESGVRLGSERIEVDGALVKKAPAIYLAMNKPRGIVTTALDERGRETVYGLLPPDSPWIGPVGRLDKASEGLLLLTNDSEWAAKITEPSSHLEKTYHVQVDCIAGEDLLARIVRGCKVDGEELRAKHALGLRQGEKHSWLEIRLDEGKNRQIRRLLKALDVSALRLVRVSIGPLELGDLKKGAVRRLTTEEKSHLDRALALGADHRRKSG